jgi:hypothetical protein
LDGSDAAVSLLDLDIHSSGGGADADWRVVVYFGGSGQEVRTGGRRSVYGNSGRIPDFDILERVYCSRGYEMGEPEVTGGKVSCCIGLE